MIVTKSTRAISVEGTELAFSWCDFSVCRQRLNQLCSSMWPGKSVYGEVSLSEWEFQLIFRKSVICADKKLFAVSERGRDDIKTDLLFP